MRFWGQTHIVRIDSGIKRALLLAALVAYSCPTARASEQDWPTILSLHFQIHHESRALPRGFQAGAEAAHRKVRGELSSMVSWLVVEKIHVYLYSDRAGYLAGRFHPPPWSEGVAVYSGRPGDKSIAVYEGVSAPVFAHELTHLVLGSYFLEGKRAPPRWLNEGLAMVIQSELAAGRRIDYGPRLGAPEPLESFLGSELRSDSPGERVGPWYMQAESLVRFLKRARSPFYFTRFCRALREGESVSRALSLIYALRTVGDFERAWEDWAAKEHAQGGSSRLKMAAPGVPKTSAAPRPEDMGAPDEPVVSSSGTVRLLR